MVPTFIDFTCSPPRSKNVALVTNDSVFSGDHVILGNDMRVVIEFEVSRDDLEQIVVSFVGLVSRLNVHEGYSPVTLSINGRAFVQNYTVPGGGNLPQKCPWPIPSELLRAGTNTFAFQVAPDAHSYFWLYHFAVDTARDPDQSEQARLAVAADTALFTYRVNHAWKNMQKPHEATNLTLFIDSGEAALPSMLSWRDQKDNMASISFHSSTNEFIGYYQRSKGGPTAYRGRIISRQAAPEISPAELNMPIMQPISTPANSVFVYRTAHSWGGDGRWHKAAPLAFYLDCGEDTLTTNLTWRDQKNNAGSIGFVDDMSSFYGYYQRVGEGPISYKGELVKIISI